MKSGGIWRQAVGMGIGVMLAAGVLWWSGGKVAVEEYPAGEVISECDGAMGSVVIQWTEDAEFAAGVYRQFLGELSGDVTVYAVCPDRGTFDLLMKKVGGVKCAVKGVVTGHAMTTWARDRWLALRGERAGEAAVLMRPHEESGAEVWAARAGDERIAGDLAKAEPRRMRAWGSELYFDGGDFAVDGERAFVVPNVLRRNLQRTVTGREELVKLLQRRLKKRVVLLEESPEHHAGMFMMVAGKGTVVVGDPGLGRRYVEGSGEELLPGGADFSEGTQRVYDAVAGAVEREGYRVVRIPQAPGRDGKTFLTYVNVIIDCRRGVRTVYMPEYRGVEGMNAAAKAVWESLGYRVKGIDCTEVYRHFGCLHCLVNVVGRESR